MEKVQVSICVIAHNEEKNIVDCLESVAGRAAQVVVVDAGSTDRTVELIKKQFPDVTVKSFPNETNLNVNKMRSFELADQEWIFYLDADERFTDALWSELAHAVKDGRYAGYRVGRKNIYFGQWLRYGGQYPELQPRLFRRGKGKFAMQHVHEFLEIDGEVGELKEPFIHLTYPTVDQYFRKFNFYADFQAKKWAGEGVRWSARNHWKFGVFRPTARFLQKYVAMAGFRDGFLGFFVAFMQGVGELAAYVRVYDHAPKDGTGE